MKKIVNPNAFKIFYTGEPTDPKIEGYDLSLGFDYLENENYMRLPLYYLYFDDKLNIAYKRESSCNPSKKHFACFLVSNGKFKTRNNIFHKLSLYKEVASGGKYLNNLGRVVPQNETNQFLSECKFVIAYENNFTQPGYITEKVFQAYYAGALPIYASEPRAANDINKKAVVYRGNFNSDEEMIEYIKELDNNDQKYCEKWNEPILADAKMNYSTIKEKLTKQIISNSKFQHLFLNQAQRH